MESIGAVLLINFVIVLRFLRSAFHFIDFIDELFGSRQVELVFACENSLIVFGQSQLHRRIVFVGAEQNTDSRVLILRLHIAVVVIDIHLQLSKVLVREFLRFQFNHHKRAQQAVVEHKVGEVFVIFHK